MAGGRAARREDLAALLAVAAPAGRAGWLVGDTSQLWEGWLERVGAIHLATDDARTRIALAAAAARLGLALVLESPAEVIPLPAGSAERHRSVAGAAGSPTSILTAWPSDAWPAATSPITAQCSGSCGTAGCVWERWIACGRTRCRSSPVRPSRRTPPSSGGNTADCGRCGERSQVMTG